MVNISGKQALAIGIVAVLLTAAYGTMVWVALTEWVPPWVVVDDDKDKLPPDTQFSPLKFTGTAEDATTSVTGASGRCWFDENYDGVMQFSELGTFTEASGIYTSNEEYPINIAPTDDYPDGVEFDIWVQSYATNYQIVHEKVSMTGQRNSDGSAKSVGTLYYRTTDDAMTYSGLIGNVEWDEDTDYNFTTNGADDLAKATIKLSAADKGLSSQVWEDFDYETAYGIDKDHPFYVKWDEIIEGANDAIVIQKNSIMAADFFCIFMTIANQGYLSPATGDFDLTYDDNTNWYGISFVSESWGDLFYNTADPRAPIPEVAFTVGTISTTGATAAAFSVQLWQGCTYEEMMEGDWTKSTVLALGADNNDYDWVS